MTDHNDIAPAEPVEILLAEDEPSDADLCLRALKRKKIANHIVWVKDGAEALDFLFARGRYASRNGTDRPRLLLLDIKMPKVDGFEVLRQIRADERLATMPVVIMTSSSEERDIAEGYHLGVNSYVPKPVNFASFQQAVEDVGLYWMVLNKVPGTIAVP
jgi:two-component system response regulator